jgi:hypothetical protein
VLLLLAGGAYVVMSGGLGGSTTEPSQLSAMNPPPQTATPESSSQDPSGASVPPPTAQPPAGDPAAVTTPPAPGGSAAGESAGRTGQSATSSRGRAAGATPQTALRTTPETAPAPQAPAQPVNPAVAFRCAGAANVCASLRGAIGPAFDAQSIVSVSDAGKADILVEARVEVVSERTEQMFGTTFVTRTYSVELSGEARATSQAVPMPASTTFSFDARVGQERLDGQMRVIAASAAERIRSFWKKQ